MITDPQANDAFTSLLMSDLTPAEDIDNSSTGPDNAGETESLTADAGPDEAAEDTDETSPEESGELEVDAAPEAPGEPVVAFEGRFKDGAEAYNAWKNADRELGKKQSRIQQLEAELANQNRQLQQQRLADPAQLSPEQYEALAAEAQRQGFDTPEDYVADQRLEAKIQDKLGGGFHRQMAYDQARAFSSTLPGMDVVGARVAEILEESGALDAVPKHLPATEQARQMQEAIRIAHLTARNEHLERELPKVRRATEQRAQKEAASKRAAKQSSSVAGASRAVPSPGAASERSPADELFRGGGRWYDNVRK